jgi:hypothetical protein
MDGGSTMLGARRALTAAVALVVLGAVLAVPVVAQVADPPALQSAAGVGSSATDDLGAPPVDAPEPFLAPDTAPAVDTDPVRPKAADAEAGGSISGTVVADGSGAPLAGICAIPFPATGGTNVASVATAANGTYLVSGIPAGNYKVRFQDCVSPIDYAAEYFDNRPDFNSAASLAVTEGGTLAGINASLAIGGRIAGTVVADGTGTPLAGICVSAPTAATGSSIFRVNTAADGSYSIAGLAVGPYKVRFEDCNSPFDWAAEFYDNQRFFNDGNTVTVTAGATTAGINASMGAAGSLSGTIVADGSGSPLAGICAVPFPSAGGSNVTSATSAADGTYLITGLAVGTYKVRFQDCVGSVDYAMEHYNNQLEFGPANLVTVNASATTSGINASMGIGGRISGTVVAEGTGAPLAGICVGAPFATSNSSLFRVTTGADGSFVIAGMAPASYKLRFEDCVSPIEYATEHYDNKADFGSGNTLTVTAGVTLTANAALAIGGSVSGTVVADASGTPLSGICVDLSLPSGGFIGRATSAANGTYLLAGVAAGSYKVRFEDCVTPLDYAAEYYDNKPDFGSGNLVAVTAGATTSGVNAGLAIGGRISGTVVAEGTGTPLSGICVSAPNPTNGSSIFRVTTGADGTYVISGLAAGNHKVRFEDCVTPIDYAVEYYDNKSDLNSGNLVSVTAGATTSGVNAALALGGRVTGTVVADAGGAPLAGICVSPISTSSNSSLFRPQTASDGTYSVAGLPVGTYKVKFEDCVSPLDHAAEYFDNTLNFDAATVLSVTAGGTVAGVSAGLAIAGRISGTVVADGTGAPVGGICVNAFDAVSGWSLFRPSTSADGSYLISGLKPGNYRVRFEDCNGPVEWVSEYYDNKPGGNTANLVAVTAGVTTSGINASLAPRPANVRKPADFDGDGDTDRSVYRNGAWFAEGQATGFIGTATDIPVPGDYDGDGDSDRAVYREGTWFTEGQATAFLGLAGDIPVPGDYDGDGRTERAVYRPSVGAWFVEGQATVFFGNSADIPVPGDYDGNGTTDIAIFRPAVGGWYIDGQPTVFNGLNGDIPVPGDYDNSGTTDKAVFRPSVGGWYTAGQSTVFTGLSGDIPVAGDYDGDGDTDRAIWRKAVGGWYVNGQTTVFLGLSGDIPLPIPQAIYRVFFTP